MTVKEVKVPNIGGVSDVEVIEILVSPGDEVNKEQSLITLESDKASMEIPSPYQGVIENVNVKVGNKVSEGALIVTMKTTEEEKSAQDKTTPPEEKTQIPFEEPKAASQQIKDKVETSREKASPESVTISDKEIHAGPGIRRFAREFGIDLSQVRGSGAKNRILKEDLQKYVKSALSEGPGKVNGFEIPKMPEIDFSQFGETEQIPMTKIKKLTGVNVHRSWISIPHVTQFGKADITDLEQFRKMKKDHFEKEGVKLTPLVFIMKAVVASLKEFPYFNASLDSKGEKLILKKYYNLGIAVDTPNGLVVPVVRDVDKKGTLELAKELAELSLKARQKGLTPAEMSGSCFTISSLGGIGGTAFTPIINAPDVAILGVSKSEMAPVYEKGQFVPKLLLPLSLSYDHRVIDGADGARFMVYLAECLSDIRTLLL